MDVEKVFRATFGVKKEHDVVDLIEAAVNVAAMVDPDKLRKHRSRIIKLLFDENPTHSDDLFSDDEHELCFGDYKDDDRASEISVAKGFKKGVVVSDDSKIVDFPEIKKGFKEAVVFSDDSKTVDFPEIKKGFKKAVNLSQVVVAAPPRLSMSEKIVNHKSKFEVTKRVLKQMYDEEAEKKAKRKIECIDFPPESKKLCKEDVRERIVSRMKRMKAGHGKPKYHLHSGIFC